MSSQTSKSNFSNMRLCRQRRKIWLISIFFIITSLFGLISSSLNPSIGKPLRPGLDFTGGTQITLDRICNVKCEAINTLELSQSLAEINLPSKVDETTPNLFNSKVKLLDESKSVILRLPFLSAEESNIIINKLYKNYGPFSKDSISIDTIGPTLGSQLLKSSLVSILVAFLCISLYINFRYDRRFSFLALLALTHDIIIVCGCFSWFGILFNIEVDSLFAVSLLTIAGYSVNNTVVVFDRIREMSDVSSDLSLHDQIDNAVSATLTRTIYTSGTTLLPLIGLIIWGGSTLYWFAISLSLGVVFGSWSSIALAPSLLSLTRDR